MDKKQIIESFRKKFNINYMIETNGNFGMLNLIDLEQWLSNKLDEVYQEGFQNGVIELDVKNYMLKNNK